MTFPLHPESWLLLANSRLSSGAFAFGFALACASGSGIYGVNLFNIMNTAEESQAARESAGNPES